MTRDYATEEQREVTETFADMLYEATKDGGRKRAAGEKPSWKVDDAHVRAIFSHLGKWSDGELYDEDSGAHPLVHAAWRCLAVAWQEMQTVEGLKSLDVTERSYPEAPLVGEDDYGRYRAEPPGPEELQG